MYTICFPEKGGIDNKWRESIIIFQEGSYIHPPSDAEV